MNEITAGEIEMCERCIALVRLGLSRGWRHPSLDTLRAVHVVHGAR